MALEGRSWGAVRDGVAEDPEAPAAGLSPDCTLKSPEELLENTIALCPGPCAQSR